MTKLLEAKQLILFEKYDEIEIHKREINKLSVEYADDVQTGIRSVEDLSEDLHLIKFVETHVGKIEALIDVLNNDIDNAALEMMDAQS